MVKRHSAAPYERCIQVGEAIIDLQGKLVQWPYTIVNAHYEGTFNINVGYDMPLVTAGINAFNANHSNIDASLPNEAKHSYQIGWYTAWHNAFIDGITGLPAKHDFVNYLDAYTEGRALHIKNLNDK